MVKGIIQILGLMEHKTKIDQLEVVVELFEQQGKQTIPERWDNVPKLANQDHSSNKRE